MSTEQLDVSLQFIASGVNRVVNALDWGPHDLLAYAAHHAAVVYNFQEAKVLGTLLGHTDQVTCIKWIPTSGGSAHSWLLSGAADCSIRCWQWSGPSGGSPWNCVAVLQGHEAGVSSLCVHSLSGGRLLLSSTADERRVLLWEGQQQAENWIWLQVQELQLTTAACMPLCTAISRMPGKPDWLLLAVGGTDMIVRLCVRPPGQQAFELGCKLLGAESWIRALAFTLTDCTASAGGALLLASACQDRYVRVWVVEEETTGASASTNAPVSSITRFASTPTLKVAETRYRVSLEGVLLGHEDWVHSVCWQQPHPASGAIPVQLPRSALRLLSASMDRTMIIWMYDARSQLWMNQASVGDAGATCLGYYGGVFSPDGQHIGAHGFTGALHLWSWNSTRKQWAARHALGGHWGSITDCSWGADGRCLFTVSHDQTARVFTNVNGHWCEIARPQVHGHNLRCLASLPASADQPGGPSYVYASGSEEKVIRVFEAPQAFLDTLAMAQGKDVLAVPAVAGRDKRSLGAALPALGLSNKAVHVHGAGMVNGGIGSGMDGGSYTEGPDFVPCASPAAVAGPPLEEHLAQNTLWPEVHKLYGHGNDLFCLAADPAGRYLASACVAKTAAAASIWIWSMREWKPLCELPGHTLTVTQMEFSHDGRCLLTASRDRSFCVFRTEPESPHATAASSASTSVFQLVRRCKAAHARVIWGVSWSPDDVLFATCSRDQTVKLWAQQHMDSIATATAAAAPTGAPDGSQPPVHVLQLGKHALPCAVAFAPTQSSSNSNCRRYVLAVGKEDGGISLLSVINDNIRLLCANLWDTSLYASHAASITRIRWRTAQPEELDGQLDNNSSEGDDTVMYMASSSSDHALRVFRILYHSG